MKYDYLLSQEKFLLLEENTQLKIAYNEHIIDADGVKKFMQKKKEELFNKLSTEHPYKITPCPDGRFQTYIKDDTCKYGRKKIHASSEVEMLEKLEEIYHKEKRLTGMTTLKELFPIWFDYKENLQAEPTMKRYKSDWKKYIEDSNIANIPLCELKNPDLKLWAASTITKYGLDKHAYTNISGIVSQLLEYANDLELIDKTFTKLSKAGKGLLTQKSKKTDGSKIFRADELIAIRKMAMDEFQHPNVQRKFELAPLALLMMSQTGLRISEVCCLEWNDLAEDKAHIRVQRMFRRDSHIVIYHTKGTYGSRDVVVTDEVRKYPPVGKRAPISENRTRRQVYLLV
jgi:integrase